MIPREATRQSRVNEFTRAAALGTLTLADIHAALASGVTIDAEDPGPMSALARAVVAGHSGVVATLLALGANPNKRTPIDKALRISHRARSCCRAHRMPFLSIVLLVITRVCVSGRFAFHMSMPLLRVCACCVNPAEPRVSVDFDSVYFVVVLHVDVGVSSGRARDLHPHLPRVSVTRIQRSDTVCSACCGWQPELLRLGGTACPYVSIVSPKRRRRRRSGQILVAVAERALWALRF